jgi:hypothetical protein
VTAEHRVDGPEAPRRDDRRHREAKSAEDRRVLANAGRKHHPARIAVAREDQDFRAAVGQRIEQILIIACDTAARAIAITDESEDASPHRVA